MKPSVETLFDVVVYDVCDRKVDAIIGVGLRRWDGTGSGRNTAELRKQTGEERVNDRYGVEIVNAGAFSVGSILPKK